MDFQILIPNPNLGKFGHPLPRPSDPYQVLLADIAISWLKPPPTPTEAPDNLEAFPRECYCE